MSGVEPGGYVPRLAGFFVDRHAGDGTFTGWVPVAWGFMPRPCGPVVTLSPDGPPTVTWWRSLDAAEAGLDALAGTVRDEVASVRVGRILRIALPGTVDGPLLPGVAPRQASYSDEQDGPRPSRRRERGGIVERCGR